MELQISDRNVKIDGGVFVCEGWWSPSVVAGKVHDHPPERKSRAWPEAMHRECEPVFTKRALS